jgi:hypothetical protein
MHYTVQETGDNKMTITFIHEGKNVVILYLERRPGREIKVVAEKLFGDREGGKVTYFFDTTIKQGQNVPFVNNWYFAVWRKEVKRRWNL